MKSSQVLSALVDNIKLELKIMFTTSYVRFFCFVVNIDGYTFVSSNAMLKETPSKNIEEVKKTVDIALRECRRQP